MAQHARLANDRPWLLAHKKQILDGANWISREKGLFPSWCPKNPCAGLNPGQVCVRHADEWGPGRRGILHLHRCHQFHGTSRDGRCCSRNGGQPEGDDILREAEAYRKDIIAAVDRLTDKVDRSVFHSVGSEALRKLDHAYLNGVCGPINLAYAGRAAAERSADRSCHPLEYRADAPWKVPSGRPGQHVSNKPDLGDYALELGREEEFLRMFYTILGRKTRRPIRWTTF